MRNTVHLLDLCAGTGEIAYGFLKRYPRTTATLLDFCPQMLQVAEQKSGDMKKRISLVCGDAMKLPFDHESFDGATISYGIRNVEQPDLCFDEVYRCLRPGATFAILELTRPPLLPVRMMHKLYTKTFLPITGRLLTDNADAYRYLADSVQQFSSPKILSQQLKGSGFSSIKIMPLSLGIATIITCKK